MTSILLRWSVAIAVVSWVLLLPSTAAADAVCPACGKHYPDGGKFCLVDGCKLTPGKSGGTVSKDTAARTGGAAVAGMDIFSSPAPKAAPVDLGLPAPSGTPPVDLGLPAPSGVAGAGVGAPSVRGVPAAAGRTPAAVGSATAGIVVKPRGAFLEIVALCTGSHAVELGLAPGDKIIRLGGRSVRTLSSVDVTRLFRGGPGTFLSMAVVRRGSGRVENLSIQRRHCGLPMVGLRTTQPGPVTVAPSASPSARPRVPGVRDFEAAGRGQVPSTRPLSGYGGAGGEPVAATAAVGRTPGTAVAVPAVGDFAAQGAASIPVTRPTAPVQASTPFQPVGGRVYGAAGHLASSAVSAAAPLGASGGSFAGTGASGTVAVGMSNGRYYESVPMKTSYVPVRFTFDLSRYKPLDAPEVTVRPAGGRGDVCARVTARPLEGGSARCRSYEFMTLLQPGSYRVRASFTTGHKSESFMRTRRSVQWPEVVVAPTPSLIRLKNGVFGRD